MKFGLDTERKGEKKKKKERKGGEKKKRKKEKGEREKNLTCWIVLQFGTKRH